MSARQEPYARLRRQVLHTITQRLRSQRMRSVYIPCCGRGPETVLIAKLLGPAARVRAVDIDDAAIGQLRRRLDAFDLHWVTTEVADVEQALPGRASVDLVVCSFGLHLLTRPQHTLGAWVAALTNVGQLILVTWCPGRDAVVRSPLSKLIDDGDRLVATPIDDGTRHIALVHSLSRRWR